MPINPQNIPALTYWSNTKYTEEDVLKFCRAYDDKYMFAKLDFRKSGGIDITISRTVERLKQGHFPTNLNFYKAVQSYYPDKPLNGTIIAFFEDGLWSWIADLARIAPIFHCGQYIHDYYSFVIPDATFLENDKCSEDKKAIDLRESSLPWDKKLSKLIWRGAGSGIGINTKDWMNAPRVKLCLKAKEFKNKDLIDVGITKVLSVDYPDYETGLIKLDLCANEMSFLDFLDYKYQIDLDGICCAWLSYFRKLYSKSVTFKVASDYRQWYYHGLVPWKHYIPVSKDMDDLEELIIWAKEHDSLCREIALNATDYMSTLTLTQTIEETYHTLANLFEAQSKLA
jgi:hypothetical protein